MYEGIELEGIWGKRVWKEEIDEISGRTKRCMRSWEGRGRGEERWSEYGNAVKGEDCILLSWLIFYCFKVLNSTESTEPKKPLQSTSGNPGMRLFENSQSFVSIIRQGQVGFNIYVPITISETRTGYSWHIYARPSTSGTQRAPNSWYECLPDIIMFIFICGIT